MDFNHRVGCSADVIPSEKPTLKLGPLDTVLAVVHELYCHFGECGSGLPDAFPIVGQLEVLHVGGDVSGKHDEGDFFVGHGENIARGRSLGKSFRQCGEEPAAPCVILPL